MIVDQSILIISQVVLKLFVDTQSRLPDTDQDVERLKNAILKTYKAALLSQAEINKTK